MFSERIKASPTGKTGPGFAQLLTVSLVFFVLSYLSHISAWSTAGPFALRLAGPMLLGMLLLIRAARRWVIAYLLACLLAWVYSSVLAGRALDLSVRFGVSRMCEIGVAYALLAQLRFDGHRQLSLAGYLKLMLVTLVAAPLAGLSVVAALGGVSQTAITADIYNWWVGNAVGMVIVLPAMLAWGHSPWRLMRAGTNFEAALYYASIVAVSVLALYQTSNPFILIALPMLAAAFRLNLLGSAVAALLVLGTVVGVHRCSPVTPAGLASLDGTQIGFGAAMFYLACSVVPALLICIEETTRADAAEALRRRSKQLRLIADTVPALIGYIDRGERYSYANQKYADWLDQPHAAIVGARHDALLGEGIDPSFSLLLQKAFTGENQVFDARLGARDLLVNYVADLQDGGVEGVFVLASDVSELKKVEQMLHTEKERALVTLSSIGDAVVTCDTDMRIMSLNPVAENLTGWNECEALGKPFSEVIMLLDIETGAPALSPMKIAICENRVVGLQENCELVRRDGLRSGVEDSAAPIRDRQNKVVGGVMVFHDVSESRAMALRMSHMAQHDLLTDLPNRVLLQDRLSQALTAAPEGGCGALLFLDIDHFKRINDTLGHEAGDEVLQLVGKRLLEAAGPAATVSRQGGDEFVLLLSGLASPHDAARVADKVISAIEEPTVIRGQLVHVSASVGITLFPQDGTDTKALFKQADAALYHAKRAGRGRFHYFTDAMSDSAEQRMHLEQSLRVALEQGDFFLVYQPKVLGLNGKVIGMEALVRWRDRSTGEIVPPGVFIPIAEECGLIVKLDQWVMREACRQNRAWQDEGLLPIPVSVNVSLASFDTERIFEQVCNTLSQTGLAARWLDIEFTESKIFHDPKSAQDLIERLKRLGVQVTMDDFGTGYSSLSYAARYEFDALKIDQSFVSGLPGNLKHLAIVKAILSMAHALNYRVIAEGVETLAQAHVLCELGCEEMQGYFYSRPLAAEQFRAILALAELAAEEPPCAGDVNIGKVTGSTIAS